MRLFELAAFLLAAVPRTASPAPVHRLEAVDVEPEPPPKPRSRPTRSPPAPPPRPSIAARRFVVWMQDHGFTGEKPWGGPNGIWAFYGWHCHDTNVQPVPDNMFAAELSRVVSRRQVRDRSSGSLQRFTWYLIPEPPEAVAKRQRPAERRAA